KTVIRHVFNRLHPSPVEKDGHRDQAESDHDENNTAPVKIRFAPALSVLFLRVTIELRHKPIYVRKVTMNRLAMQNERPQSAFASRTTFEFALRRGPGSALAGARLQRRTVSRLLRQFPQHFRQLGQAVDFRYNPLQ